MSGTTGLVMRPLLMCEVGHTADVPHVGRADGISGPVECTECWKPMILITYGIVDSKPMWGNLGETARRRASGTWWR